MKIDFPEIPVSVNSCHFSPKFSLWMNEIVSKLKELAQTLIQVRIDSGVTVEQKALLSAMYKEPDSPLYHEQQWHEYGIITHTLEVLKSIERVDTLLGLDIEKVQWSMEQLKKEEIASVSKWELFIASMSLHDIGKFLPNFKVSKDTGKEVLVLSHTGHEERSAKIVREEAYSKVKELFSPLWNTLTEKQGEYIARCIELHYEFGNIREEAKKNSSYTVGFTTTQAFKDICARSIIKVDDKKNYLREIGLYFIFDNAGKIDPSNQISTEPTENDITTWETYLLYNQLPPKLISAMKQFPVNRAVAITYLELIKPHFMQNLTA